MRIKTEYLSLDRLRYLSDVMPANVDLVHSNAHNVRELLKKADLVDEWGRSLKVEVTAEGVVVRSAGRDGRFHTRDDWSLGES